MPGRNDLIKNELTICQRKEVAASLQLLKGKKPTQEREDSFGKGLHKLKDHVLNRLMTGRCPKSLQLRPKFHSLFLQNSYDFQKSATFKGLKSSSDVSFNPENGAFSKIE